MDNSERQQIIQTRYEEFIRSLSVELGTPILGSVTAIHFADNVEVGATLASLPNIADMKNILSRLSNKFTREIQKMTTIINQRKGH